MSDVEAIEGDNTVEEALQAIQDVKQKFNFIRSQRLLSEAVLLGGSSPLQPPDIEDDSNAKKCISDLEDKIDCLCIQEGALQFSLESDTIGKLRSSAAISSKLQKLLDLHLKQESRITKLSSKLFEEHSRLQEAQSYLTQTLEDYMAYEKKQSQQFKENSTTGDEESLQKMRKQLKEIRFMQLIIPHMVNQFDGDLTEKEWFAKLCQEVRDPILSVDDLQ